MTSQANKEWLKLNEEIIACNRCPRLRKHCREIAKTKRKAFQEWEYWGRPVENYGDASARLLILGLAPAAHGANRTGRMFTGDRSGDWLYRAMHRAGFANQAEATHRDDGLKLINAAITAAAHCAPPENKPSPDELKACRRFFSQTLELSQARVFLALGGLAWTEFIKEASARSWLTSKPPAFQHGGEYPLTDGRTLLGSYHPSQQNTFTGRLTEEMFDSIFQRCQRILSGQ